jgi:hypothetical protein
MIVKLNLIIMKNLIWIIAFLLLSPALNAQKSIDALFDKYAGKEGFVTVTINGNLLKLAAKLDDDKEAGSMPKDLTQIRILAQEDQTMKVDNFYNLVTKDLDLKQYEEFMQVKSSDQDVKMLVRTEGDLFREFLLIVGGKDNALIQIKGNMSLQEAKKFAEGAKKDHGINLINNH